MFGPLELELQEAARCLMWELGTEPRSFTTTVRELFPPLNLFPPVPGFITLVNNDATACYQSSVCSHFP